MEKSKKKNKKLIFVFALKGLIFNQPPKHTHTNNSKSLEYPLSSHSPRKNKQRISKKSHKKKQTHNVHTTNADPPDSRPSMAHLSEHANRDSNEKRLERKQKWWDTHRQTRNQPKITEKTKEEAV